MKFIIFVNVKLKFIIFEGKRPLVKIDQWPEQTYDTWIFIKLTHFFFFKKTGNDFFLDPWKSYKDYKTHCFGRIFLFVFMSLTHFKLFSVVVVIELITESFPLC